MNNGRWYYEEENRERKILAPATESLVARARLKRGERALRPFSRLPSFRLLDSRNKRYLWMSRSLQDFKRYQRYLQKETETHVYCMIHCSRDRDLSFPLLSITCLITEATTSPLEDQSSNDD